MASISSMISFIVLLLATYSSSAPLVPELQNATSVPQVENATNILQFENLVVLARREVAEKRAVTDTVGLSSSSSEDDTDKTVQTTEKIAVREMEDSPRNENLIVLPGREVAEERAVTDTVGLSSSSSENDTDKTVQTTEKIAVREMEDSLRNENNAEREVDAESFDANENERSFTEDTFTTEMNHKRETDAESFDANENERSFTEDTFTTEMNHKREADAESFDANENERSFTEDTFTTEMNHERAIEVQSFESSTVEETTVQPSSEVKNVKRSSGSGSWLSAEADDNAERTKRSSGSGSWLSAEADDNAERTKRSSGSGSWLSAEADENAERTKRSSGSGSWLSAEADENAERTKRSSGSGSWLSADSNGEVQKRSMGEETSTVEDSSVPSSSEAINIKRDMQQSSSLSAEASEEFNRRAIGSIEMNESSTIIAETIESESTTDEQPSSSTEVIRKEMSSTVESETVVTPVGDSIRPSPVPKESKSKILAIIPGQISKSKIVIDPATGKTAGFRPVHQIQLSQGQNETITEEKKPNY